MNRYIVRIPGLRLTITASSTWDAIAQARKAYPLHSSGSAKVVSP